MHCSAEEATGTFPEVTCGRPFWVVLREDLDKRHIPEDCQAKVPNTVILGRWVDAIGLHLGDALFTRAGRPVSVTNMLVRYS
jgi:hypothetical protein